jgi:ParB-like chromosome segregation protein Spo0J
MRAEPYQVMPPLADAEYDALKASIAAGYDPARPIVVEENGNVLDGHHRQRACGELGITPTSVVLPGLTEDQKHDYAMRANLACRHLTQLQKRELIAAELERDPARSDREIGRLCGADHKTVAAVRQRGEFPQTGRWHRGATPSLEERLASSAARMLEAADEEAAERAKARECARHWRESWAWCLASLQRCAEVWTPVIAEHTGYASCWEWIQRGDDVAGNWACLAENVGYLQGMTGWEAAWFGVDSDPIRPAVADVELLLRGAS